MQELTAPLEKLDTQILHALQIWPRVSWMNLGLVLNVDPATASRHWARMHEAGVAWFSAYARDSRAVQHRSGREPFARAVVELQVRPRSLSRVFAQLQDMQEIQIIRAILGEWNVSLDWWGQSYEDLEAFIGEGLSRMSGVRAVRSFAVVRYPIDGSSWRYNGLSAEQEFQLKKILRDDLSDPVPLAEHWHPIDSRILRLIRKDARMSYTEMARRTDSVATTMKRHLSHMLRNRDLVIRCDLSRQFSSHPVTVRYFATTPVADTAEIVARLADLPDVRSCAVLLGKYNLMMNVWLESLYEASRFETALEQRTPALRIRERDMVTRFYRHGSRRIGRDGLNYSDPQT